MPKQRSRRAAAPCTTATPARVGQARCAAENVAVQLHQLVAVAADSAHFAAFFHVCDAVRGVSACFCRLRRSQGWHCGGICLQRPATAQSRSDERTIKMSATPWNLKLITACAVLQAVDEGKAGLHMARRELNKLNRISVRFQVAGERVYKGAQTIRRRSCSARHCRLQPRCFLLTRHHRLSPPHSTAPG